MCCASFVCSPMRARTRVSSRRFQSNSALSDADKTQSGPPDTLLGIISAHATSTALPALLAKHPSLPPSPSPDRDLDGGARLTRSYPSPSPICLHADLSALYLYQVVHQPLPPPLHLLPLLSGIGEGSIRPHAGSQLAPHTYGSVSAGYWRSSLLLHSRAECVSCVGAFAFPFSVSTHSLFSLKKIALF